MTKPFNAMTKPFNAMTKQADFDQLFKLAWKAQTESRFAMAISIYRQILARGENASAWLGIGQCHLENDERADALSAFRKAATLAPKSEAIKYMIAMLDGKITPSRAPDDYVLWVFDGHAETFDDHLASLSYCGPQMIAKLVSGVWENKASRRILDIGCGTGLNANFFRPFANYMEGVDISPRMLKKAAKRGYDNLYRAEAHDFLNKAPKNYYDVLLSTDVFIYIGHLERFFLLSRQCLRGNGEILCTIELGADEAPPVQLMPTGRFRQTDRYFRQCAEMNGFRVENWLDHPLRIEKGFPEPGRAYRLVYSDQSGLVKL